MINKKIVTKLGKVELIIVFIRFKLYIRFFRYSINDKEYEMFRNDLNQFRIFKRSNLIVSLIARSLQTIHFDEGLL